MVALSLSLCKAFQAITALYIRTHGKAIIEEKEAFYDKLEDEIEKKPKKINSSCLEILMPKYVKKIFRRSGKTYRS